MVRLIILLLIIFSSTYKLCAQGPGSASTINSFIVENSNVSGGGFQGDVTISDDGLTVYSSADVSGIFKSINGGLLFNNINEGLKRNGSNNIDSETIIYFSN